MQKKKVNFSDDFGLRSPVTQKKLSAKKRYTSIVACVALRCAKSIAQRLFVSEAQSHSCDWRSVPLAKRGLYHNILSTVDLVEVAPPVMGVYTGCVSYKPDSGTHVLLYCILC